jgi:serine/threonine protein kinase
MGIELQTGRFEEDGWVRGAIIGAGASGTVSLAMSRSNGQLFAVKSAASSSVSLDNEYQILQGLDSPYIVTCLGRCYSVENSVKVHNLFMEYMPGGSVGDLLIKFGGQLDESVIRAYTRGILRGIDYLHRQGIVHCDIKGKNVLVGANGVKLADFGSAKRLGDEKNGQEALQLRGTPQWMAPEVVNQVEQGPASDIWSLGCTVLEMATGRPPWSQVSNPLAAMYRIGCTEELPELPSSLSPQIRDFLEKCFRRDPKKRWTSVELLKHPFLNEDCSAMEAEKVITDPESPTSHLDFRNQVWDSYSSQTIPILPISIPSPTGDCNTMVDSNKSIEQCPRPSPRDRLKALAASCEFKVADSPNWFASPPTQWIVVRSSRDKSPTLENPCRNQT